MGRVLLACSLCLLAFAFAIEAKMAWCGPTLAATRDIGAAKALPADTPALAMQRAHLSESISQQSSFTLLPAFAVPMFAAAGAMATAGMTGARLLVSTQIPVSRRSYFFPLHFFRPPPAL